MQRLNWVIASTLLWLLIFGGVSIGQVGTQSFEGSFYGNRGNGTNKMEGVGSENGIPITNYGGYAGTESLSMTVASGSNTATITSTNIGMWQDAVKKGRGHGIAYGAGPTASVSTPANALKLLATVPLDIVFPTVAPFQVIIPNCVQTARTEWALSSATALRYQSTTPTNYGQIQETDNAGIGTCTLLVSSLDAGRRARTFYAPGTTGTPTPTAGTNSYYMYQVDFDADSGYTQVGPLGSLVNVAAQMYANDTPLIIQLDATTNPTRKKSIVEIAECTDYWPNWYYHKNDCMHPSQNNANGSYYTLTSATGVSAFTAVNGEDETGKVTFDGAARQYTFNLGQNGAGVTLQPNGLYASFGPLPNYRNSAADVQTLSQTGAPAGGSFNLTFGSQTATGIAWNASAATVCTALTNLSSIGANNVTCTGGPLPTNIVITFAGTLAPGPQAVITVDPSALTGGSSPSMAVAHTTTGFKWAVGNYMVPQMTSNVNAAGVNPTGHVFQVQSCLSANCATSTGTWPQFNQATGATTPDNQITWVETGTHGYAAFGDTIHDDRSGNWIGRVGPTNILSPPGTCSTGSTCNTIGYVGANAGAVNLDFASAGIVPFPGGVFTITYNYTTTPNWSACQTGPSTPGGTDGQSCTVGGQTWRNMGTSPPSPSGWNTPFFIGASQMRTTAPTFSPPGTIDYWGSAKYIGDDLPTSPPTAPFPDRWFFNMTAVDPATKIVTVTGENGSASTPGQSSTVTFQHDNTVPWTNFITYTNAGNGYSGNYAPQLVFPGGEGSDLIKSPTYLVAGHIVDGTGNPQQVRLNSSIIDFTGDGDAVCDSSYTNDSLPGGQWSWAGHTQVLGSGVIETDNGTADANICRAAAATWGCVYTAEDGPMSFQDQSLGNRTTGVNLQSPGCGIWKSFIEQYWREFNFGNNENEMVMEGGGGYQQYPARRNSFNTTYGLGNSNIQIRAPGFFEDAPNAFGPMDGGLNYNSNLQLDNIYDSDMANPGSQVSGTDGRWPLAEHTVGYDIRGNVHISTGYGGNTYGGFVYMPGALAASKLQMTNSGASFEDFFVMMESGGTPTQIDNSTDTNIRPYGVGVEFHTTGDFFMSNNNFRSNIGAWTSNTPTGAYPITGYKIGYTGDEITCNGTLLLNGGGGTIFTLDDLMNTYAAQAQTLIAGAPEYDICSTYTPFIRLFDTVKQDQFLNIDAGGQIWPQITTDDQTFHVNNAGTAGVKIMNPICGGTAASPLNRTCTFNDAGRTFAVVVKCANAACGAMTADTMYALDGSFQMPANTKTKVYRFRIANNSGTAQAILESSSLIGDNFQLSTNGTTAGTFVCSQPTQGAAFKKVHCHLAGYNNTTSTPQTYTFPTAFTTTETFTANSEPPATVSTTAITLPSSMTLGAITSDIIVEGY